MTTDFNVPKNGPVNVYLTNPYESIQNAPCHFDEKLEHLLLMLFPFPGLFPWAKLARIEIIRSKDMDILCIL